MHFIRGLSTPFRIEREFKIFSETAVCIEHELENNPRKIRSSVDSICVSNLSYPQKRLNVLYNFSNDFYMTQLGVKPLTFHTGRKAANKKTLKQLIK